MRKIAGNGENCAGTKVGTTMDEMAPVIDAALRIRKAAKGLNFAWMAADAENHGGDLTPWVILAMAALE